MTDGAHVRSIDAVRDFRAAMCTFAEEAREALATYDMELNRTMEWLLEDQPRYWRDQVRRCEELVVQAKIELETRRSSRLPGGETPSCIEELKALDRARRRHRFAQEKVEVVRRLGHAAQRESNEYTGRSNQLGGLFDSSLPRAIAMLDRSIAALESYAALNFHRSEPRPADDEWRGTSSMARPVEQQAADDSTEQPPAEESVP